MLSVYCLEKADVKIQIASYYLKIELQSCSLVDPLSYP